MLSKIATGEQSPGRRLLEAIASHPKVNPAWLLSGEGTPLLAEKPNVPTEGWPVKIASKLLPGPLDQHRRLLLDDTFPVAGIFINPAGIGTASTFVTRLQMRTIAMLLRVTCFWWILTRNHGKCRSVSTGTFAPSFCPGSAEPPQLGRESDGIPAITKNRHTFAWIVSTIRCRSRILVEQ